MGNQLFCFPSLRLNVNELDSSSINSSTKGYATAKLRYDAQYATFEDLKLNVCKSLNFFCF